jgi:hypothetical protein
MIHIVRAMECNKNEYSYYLKKDFVYEDLKDYYINKQYIVSFEKVLIRYCETPIEGIKIIMSTGRIYLAVMNMDSMLNLISDSTSDKEMVDEIITNLQKVEKDYNISLIKEIEWLRNKMGGE